jgi:hypothetical protein
VRLPTLLAAALTLVPLHWLERPPAGVGVPAVVFNVRSIAYDGTTRRVSAAVTNRSKTTVHIHLTGGGHGIPRFGRLPPSVCRYRNYPSCASGVVVLSGFAPGRSWSGTFAGRAPLRKVMRIAITFGYFTAPEPYTPFSWVTSHAAPL